MEGEARTETIRRQVQELLKRSAAFRSRELDKQREVAENTVAVVHVLAEPAGATVGEVDFPEFVGGLLAGTFEAIVDASIEQMRAYGELIASVAKTVDRFAEDQVTDDEARCWLEGVVPGLSETPALADLAVAAGRRTVARQRQQLLSTMVLMGINRIVVTSGQVKARGHRRSLSG